MAIKQRKQVTGTTEQINAYAGVEGQLVWNKTTKRWVGMSGTAGTNYPMASERHQHSIANVADLQKALDSKATKTELTKGLAGKAPSSHTHTSAQITDLSNTLAPYAKTIDVSKGLAGKANKDHTHTVSQITDMPKAVLSVNDITPDDSGNVPVYVGAKTVEGKAPDSKGNVYLGLHAVATSGNYNDLANKPSMPATPKAYITETWKDGSNWYRKWSDGLIEQGGAFLAKSTYSTMTFNTPFSNTDYSISGWYDYSVVLVRSYERKPESFTFSVPSDRGVNLTGVSSRGSTVYWSAVGY